ncbi:DUF2541 domain-containing protein [Photobacterium kishitanii]|uniref:DUF2541 domain-containing protein n=1 Tax=Photobacterium kishitanii TaxID=318456 RepID=A0A2T3QZV5_9GAMM|nr:DUF2541 family protein [Photobacterium kishitanii]KJG10928.1 hypothetical protein UB40_06265 [Photobacterium kishitanii]KJG59935.1 hypothetical protein UA38_02000 [Photobacterium kishitanii]KJG63217.1 hypothetical protein UA42_02385 [Photobacterium kishitanii]KJG67776.1 hypothetical protein UA40_00460 [Photobacterium kishitanii]KJG71387.1 hypothetical protein UA41_02015 [Photobacterium kishitanii]
MKKGLIGLALLAGGLVTSLPATAGTFTLGHTWLLEIGNVKGKIPFPICRNAKGFKIEAQRDLKLDRVKVRFRNGEEKTYNYYRDVKKDKDTGARLFGYERCIKHIEVSGNSEGTRAGVKVIGID